MKSNDYKVFIACKFSETSVRQYVFSGLYFYQVMDVGNGVTIYKTSRHATRKAKRSGTNV